MMHGENNMPSGLDNLSVTLRGTSPASSLHENNDGIIEVQLDSFDSSQHYYNDESRSSTLQTVDASPGLGLGPLGQSGTGQPVTDKIQKNVFKSKIFLIAVTFSTVLITAMCIGFLVHYEVGSDVSDVDSIQFWDINLPEEQQIWYERGISELKTALSRELNRRRAKNVILFVGDGMGPTTVTASRIYGYKEEGLLSWEKFPYMGLLKTYCTDKQVPDSFSTATALFGGVKTNYETGGVDSNVNLANCSASLDEQHHVQTIFKWAQSDGMRTGFVTTTRVTHATPAALYSHTPDRRWECEQNIPTQALEEGCKDIAQQLIHDEIGKSINVIMGGGRQMLVSNITGTAADPLDMWACRSKDGRNLIKEWSDQKSSTGEKYAVVHNNGDLRKLKSDNLDYVLGIFANGHLKYDHERDQSDDGMPSLKNMTLKALEVLGNSDKGFLLVVEGGMIDQAHHRGTARKALNEVLALNQAVEATLEHMKEHLDETLIIVTADHSHSLTINGHPDKGSDILGFAGKSKTENISYTTLTYGTSYKGFQVDPAKKRRADPSFKNTSDWDYTQQAAINTDENLHGGSDVNIHATGAMSYLFHSVHEQSYVAHVISFALRIGRFRDSTIAESLAALMPL